MIKIAPSVLSANFADLTNEVQKVENAGCDLLHLDVMDGHFVPNITIGPFIVKAIRSITKLKLDAHLMIENPEQYIQAFSDAGANHITIHAEACESNLNEVLDLIKSKGCTAGVSLKPKTSLDCIKPFLNKIDMVLLMTVNPGFGGQSFMPEVLPKIKELKAIYSGDIEVDGGINSETAPQVIEAGANVLVAGTAIFKKDDVHEAMRQLRGERE